MARSYRVAIVGAGGISKIHLEVLKELDQCEVIAVVDKEIGRADALAKSSKIPYVFDDVMSLIEQKLCDVAHVCVPPDAHCSVAIPLLTAGINVFVEKPMATSTVDCEAMIQAAKKGESVIGVNHNVVFNPAYLRLKEVVSKNEIGNLRHIIVVWNVSLPPLEKKMFGHWMFRAPQNVIFEQAVHPTSMVVDLAGNMRSLKTLVGKPRYLTQDQTLYDTWQVSMRLERSYAQVFLSFDRTFRSITITAVCDDGIACADLVTQRLTLQERSRWQEPFNRLLDSVRQARSIVGQGSGYFWNSIFSSFRIRAENDDFYVSMKDSIIHYYQNLEEENIHVNAEVGSHLVSICENVTRDVSLSEASIKLQKTPSKYQGETCDVTVLGGTGFIGKPLVEALLNAGKKVRVLARSPSSIPDSFHVPRLEIFCGNAEKMEDLKKVIKGSEAVVDLVFPTEGSFVDKRMVEVAENVAKCCLEYGVSKLVYASSIAALYLGNVNEVITGSTAPDSKSSKRGEYSRGKGNAERCLLNLHKTSNLSVCILRPGVVIGKGGLPLHKGLAQYMNEQHFLGWGRTNHPLPFVLVEDVAEAIRLAIYSNEYNGRTYNVVGDIRLTADEYFAELRRIWNRPLRFYPRSILGVYSVYVLKWIVKRLVGTRDALPSFRDMKSQGKFSQFDTSDIKRDLNWQPVDDRAEFIRLGLEVHSEDS